MNADKSKQTLIISCRDKWQKVYWGALLRGLDDKEVETDTIRFIDKKISELNNKIRYYKSVKQEFIKMD